MLKDMFCYFSQCIFIHEIHKADLKVAMIHLIVVFELIVRFIG